MTVLSTPALRRTTGWRRAAYRLYQSGWAGIDLLFPPHCAGCTSPGSRWCPACQHQTQPILYPICERCGRTQAHPGICRLCRKSPPAFTSLRSYTYYEGPVRNAVHRLKYKGDLALGDTLSRLMIGLLEQETWPVELVTPVPSGAAHLARRGYNQAALLAWPIARYFNLAYKPGGLVKVRQVPSQVGLTIPERIENVAGAYQAVSEIVTGKTVLVVDDVTTSGATMSECARALKAGGAVQVYGLVLARTFFPA